MLIRPRALAMTVPGLILVGLAVPRTARSQDYQEPEPPPPPAAAPEPEQEPIRQTVSEGSGLDVELAAKAGYVTPPIRGGANPFGAGFGGRVGLVYSGFYIGASVVDFLGDKDVDVSYRALLYGLELGYGLRFPVLRDSIFTLRPQVGFGDAAVYYTDPALAADVVTSASGGSSSSDTLTVNDIYLQPALLGMLSSGGHFAALEASALIIPGIQYGGADATTWVSASAQLQLGFVF